MNVKFLEFSTTFFDLVLKHALTLNSFLNTEDIALHSYDTALF